MIRIETYRTFDAREWTELVERCGGNPLHLPDVHLVENGRDALRFLVAKRGTSVVACCVGLVLSKKVMGFRLGKKTLHLPTAPAIIAEEAERKTDVYAAVAEFGRDAGCSYLVVQRSWGDDFSSSSALSRWIVDRSLEFTIDLTKTREEILASMHKYHRKNVRKASRQDGLEIVEDCTPDALLQLRTLQLGAAARAGGKGNPFTIRAKKFFRRLSSTVYQSGIGRILFAKLDGEYVAGLAYLSTASKALTVRSGANEVGYRTSAMYLLQFELISRLKESGIEEVNIGGVPEDAVQENHPQHGLYAFKRGFGGVQHIRTAIAINLKQAVTTD